MKLQHTLCTAVLCLLLLAPRVAVPEAQPADRTFAEDISVSDASSLIEEQRGNPDFAILDVRTAEEYSTGYIEGAVNIDINGEDFDEKIGLLDRNKTYLVYCRSGSRSRRALERMRERGFLRIYNLSGGIIGWRGENMPVTE